MTLRPLNINLILEMAQGQLPQRASSMQPLDLQLAPCQLLRKSLLKVTKRCMEEVIGISCKPPGSNNHTESANISGIIVVLVAKEPLRKLREHLVYTMAQHKMTHSGGEGHPNLPTTAYFRWRAVGERPQTFVLQYPDGVHAASCSPSSRRWYVIPIRFLFSVKIFLLCRYSPSR